MNTMTLTRKWYDLNKAVVTTSFNTAKSVVSVIADGVGQATGTTRDAGKTVVGQTRSAVDRTMTQASKGAKEVVGQTRSAVDRTASQASKGAKEVAGQAKAQGRIASDKIDSTTKRTADRAVKAVDHSPSTGTPYEQWTKEALYDRAQELDLDGRSTMSKKQLITALRAA